MSNFDVSGIMEQLTPLITTIMNLMLTFYLIKMIMGMFKGFTF